MGNDANGNGSGGPENPQQIRNVVLVGSASAGKTSLFERLVTARSPGRHCPRRANRLDRAAGRVGDQRPDPRQPAGHPRPSGLRRRGAGRAAGRQRRTVRGVGVRRDRRGHAAAVAGVRGGRDAPRRRGDQARAGPGRLRRDGGPLPAGVRRRPAGRHPAALRPQPGPPGQPASPHGGRLRRRHAHRSRAGRGGGSADRGAARSADGVDHRRSPRTRSCWSGTSTARTSSSRRWPPTCAPRSPPRGSSRWWPRTRRPGWASRSCTSCSSTASRHRTPRPCRRCRPRRARTSAR